ncbi:MAG TPA: transglutaminase-like domain-containing protein [Candidatus Nanoarchaeia archaeon]|nr:transglutaminase-like domain-containing protein [Candidatus Nanoarchaeia archaeon]
MKKALYTAFFSALVNACIPRYAPPPDLPSSVKQINKPEEAQQWLETVLTYKHDSELYGQSDFWAPCALTYQLRAGDCEDYAICAAALLNRDIQEGYLIYIDNPGKKDKDGKPDSGHAVFAYKMNDKWGILSNGHSEYRLPEFSNLHAALHDALSYRYSRYIVYDYSGVDLINGNTNLESKMKQIWTDSLNNTTFK